MLEVLLQKARILTNDLNELKSSTEESRHTAWDNNHPILNSLLDSVNEPLLKQIIEKAIEEKDVTINDVDEISRFNIVGAECYAVYIQIGELCGELTYVYSHDHSGWIVEEVNFDLSTNPESNSEMDCENFFEFNGWDVQVAENIAYNNAGALLNYDKNPTPKYDNEEELVQFIKLFSDSKEKQDLINDFKDNHDIDSGQLDSIVYESSAREIERINNGGIDAQLNHLIESKADVLSLKDQLGL